MNWIELNWVELNWIKWMNELKLNDMKWNEMLWNEGRKEGKKEWNETNERRRKAGMNDWMNEWSPEFNETTFHFHTLSYKPNYSFDKSQHCPERQWHTPNWSIIIGLKWAQSTMILTSIVRHWYDQQSLIDVCQQNTMYVYIYTIIYVLILPTGYGPEGHTREQS